MKCSHCGKELADHYKFCPSCGKPVGGHQITDELAELVVKAKDGDKNAVAALYEKTYSQVFYTIKSMIKDDDTVFDILQDTYIKTFTHLDSFQGNEKFLPWVRQIAANTARDWIKKKRPMLFVELDTEGRQDTPPEEQFVDERATYIPEQVIDQQETARLIREIIDELPEDQRAVIGMFYYEELSVKQIAAAMGVSESAVKSRLMYGRRKIEVKVRDLEKKGTKLYGLAPIPFLMLLFSSQKASAAELPPNRQILQNVLKSTAKPAAGIPTPTSSTVKAAGVTAGKIGIAKIAVIVFVIGTGIFGVFRFSQRDSQNTISNKEQTKQEAFTETTPKVGIPKASSEEQQEEGTDVVRLALEQYRNIINQADTYQYDPYDTSTPTGNYSYALVQMQTDDLVPTLLLSQEGKDFGYFVRVFQYDVNSGSVRQPSESMMEGTSTVGGYRGSIDMMGDGNGICITSLSSGNGNMTISRVTLDGDSLKESVEWEGNMTDSIPEEFTSTEIEWYDIGDTAVLDNWAADSQTLDSGEETPSTEMTSSSDVNRIVLTGTIGTYTYDEVVSLQGQPDPNAQWANKNETFRLIVLDAPQVMELTDEDGLRSDTVWLINISYAEGTEQYNGQHVAFSIEPYNTYWPSDTSLPLGQPSTQDIKIIE